MPGTSLICNSIHECFHDMQTLTPCNCPRQPHPSWQINHYHLLATSICGELNSWIVIIIPLLRCKAIANGNQAGCCDIIECHEEQSFMYRLPKGALAWRGFDRFVVDIGMNISCNLRLQ